MNRIQRVEKAIGEVKRAETLVGRNYAGEISRGFEKIKRLWKSCNYDKERAIALRMQDQLAGFYLKVTEMHRREFAIRDSALYDRLGDLLDEIDALSMDLEDFLFEEDFNGRIIGSKRTAALDETTLAKIVDILRKYEREYKGEFYGEISYTYDWDRCIVDYEFDFGRFIFQSADARLKDLKEYQEQAGRMAGFFKDAEGKIKKDLPAICKEIRALGLKAEPARD